MMRPVLAADLLCAGRAVLAVEPERRAGLARRLIDRAEIADGFCRSTGLLHPEFGDGTLASVARHAGLQDAPTICDPAFAKALMLVLEALIARAASD